MLVGISLEKSPSNRTTCSLCDKNIKKGEYRVRNCIGGTYSFDKYHYYHIECFAIEMCKMLKGLIKPSKKLLKEMVIREL